MKPILFNTDMVLAILAGRKTQTRRVIKHWVPNDAIWGYDVFTAGRERGEIACRGTYEDGYGEKFFIPPFQVGDLLYVRETWARFRGWCWGPVYVYKAGYDPKQLPPVYITKWHWHPSIHMPKEAARIFLRVTGLRAERLQDITNVDAVREGCNPIWHRNESGATVYEGTPIDSFRQVWDRTTTKYDWSVNPWVWVIDFERVSEAEAYGIEMTIPSLASGDKLDALAGFLKKIVEVNK